MRKYSVLSALLVLLIAWAVACDKADEGNGVVVPDDILTGEPGVPDSLALSRVFEPLLANGVDQVTVVATVVDGVGRGLSDIGVVFTTDRGSIEPFATTGSDGVARTVLTSEASTQDITATIVAVASADSNKAVPLENTFVLLSRSPLSEEQIAGALQKTKQTTRSEGLALGSGGKAELVLDQVEVPMIGITLTLVANPTVIPADGISESQVTANLIETTRRIPIEGQDVLFGSTAGTITGRVLTDESGTATATLRGLSSGALAEITAFYGDLLTATTSVTFSALTLTLEATSSVLPADGSSAAAVIARLVNEERNPVAGARIDFSTTLGTVSSPAETDDNGEASSTLRAGTTTGSATVTARFGDNLSASTTVTLVDQPTTSSIVLAADPSTVPADGSSEVELRATPLDATGNHMPDGTLVSFAVTSGSGEIVGAVAATQDGEARSKYVAGTSPGGVTITASSGPAETSVPVVLTALEAGGINLSADPQSILADGIALTTITAVVTDIFGNPVAPGTVVAFRTSLGVLEDITPTDASGRATAKLRANRFITGTARVTVSASGAQETVDVSLVSESASNIVAAHVDHASIGVRGAGATETATVTFEVRDANGIPVDESHGVSVDFSIVPTTGESDATVSPSFGSTNERGWVATTVNAGFISGPVEVLASSGGIISQPIRVAIHGGLPDSDHFSISFERLNIEGLVFDGILNGVTAHVGDIHGNPVPDSTIAWFYATHGLVQGSDDTDDHGQAVVWEITAAPRPQIPGGDGLVTICARTVDRNGAIIETCGQVMWSGETIVEITDPAGVFEVPNAGFIDITYRVRDANNNPLTGETTISVMSTEGSLGGDTDLELPDTQNQAFTTFEVTLSDANPESDQPKPVTVTVSVASRNGNRSARISGTIR